MLQSLPCLARGTPYGESSISLFHPLVVRRARVSILGDFPRASRTQTRVSHGTQQALDTPSITWPRSCDEYAATPPARAPLSSVAAACRLKTSFALIFASALCKSANNPKLPVRGGCG